MVQFLGTDLTDRRRSSSAATWDLRQALGVRAALDHRAANATGASYVIDAD